MIFIFAPKRGQCPLSGSNINSVERSGMANACATSRFAKLPSASCRSHTLHAQERLERVAYGTAAYWPVSISAGATSAFVAQKHRHRIDRVVLRAAEVLVVVLDSKLKNLPSSLDHYQVALTDMRIEITKGPIKFPMTKSCFYSRSR